MVLLKVPIGAVSRVQEMTKRKRMLFLCKLQGSYLLLVSVQNVFMCVPVLPLMSAAVQN